MSFLISNQVQWNEQSSSKWNVFSSHRLKVSGLLESKHCLGSDRVCILGAGNCNDLDLPLIANLFYEVHLVDLDDQALSRGLSTQCLKDCRKIYPHGNIEITGTFDFLERFFEDIQPSIKETENFIQYAELPLDLGISEPFDVVVSVCLLSQIIEAVNRSLGQNHPCLYDFILKVRNHHIEQLIQLTSSRGWSILIMDLVSSDSFPAMKFMSEKELSNSLSKIILDRNFFHGVNPYKISSILSSDPNFSSLVDKIQIVLPWSWNCGPRVYAVCAVIFRRV
jgi:hypothetical protein